MTGVHAWCVRPNHYHLPRQRAGFAQRNLDFGNGIGRTSFNWNKEENTRGRQVWHAAADRFMRGERHFWATMNASIIIRCATAT